MLTTDRYKLRPQIHKTTGTLRIVIYARLSKNRSGLTSCVHQGTSKADPRNEEVLRNLG